MEELPGITTGAILVTNGEGEDDEEEWHLEGFGRDAEYWEIYGIYRWFSERGQFAYSGGWAEQLAIHIEIIDLFSALDATIERPKGGE